MKPGMSAAETTGFRQRRDDPGKRTGRNACPLSFPVEITQEQGTRRRASQVTGKSRKKEQKGFDFESLFCYLFRKSKITF
jgi:hypothetical protein